MRFTQGEGQPVSATYRVIAGKFNMPVDSTREAIYRLVKIGVLIRELRTITEDGFS